MRINYLFQAFFCLIFCLAGEATAISQIDSLLTELKKAKDDTNKVNILKSITRRFRERGDWERSSGYLLTCDSLAKRLNFREGMAEIKGMIANGYSYEKKFQEAIKLYAEAIEIEKSIPRKERIPHLMNRMAGAYAELGQEKKAVDLAMNAIKIFESFDQKEDQVNTFLRIADYFKSKKNYKRCLEYLEMGLNILESFKNERQSAEIFLRMSFLYNRMNDGQKSEFYHRKLIGLIENTTDREIRLNYLEPAVKWYKDENNFEKVIQLLNSNMIYFEKMKDLKGLALINMGTASIYEDVANYEKAVDFGLKALEYAKQLKDQGMICQMYGNIGWYYQNKKDYKNALDFQLNAFKLAEKLNAESNVVALALGNLGIIYNKLGDFEKAISHSERALNLFERTNHMVGIAEAYNNIGSVYQKLNKPQKALEYIYKGYKIAIEFEDKLELANSYEYLAATYSQLNDFKNAFQFQSLFLSLKDSISNQENSEKISKIQTSLEKERREKEVELLNKEAEIKAGELKQQKIINYSAFGGIGLMVLLVFFIFRGYQAKQKANYKLTSYNNEILAKKNEIEIQHLVISEKNRYITDSINYAQRIQYAMLPDQEILANSVPDSFILFKPKDIVSGDFYFIDRSGQKIIIGACDCTGHGVPGAFMSMIGSEKLGEAVSQTQTPGEILALLNRGIKSSLHQSESDESTRDGMDLALVSLKFKVANSKLETLDDGAFCLLEYAGANRPLWIIKKGSDSLHEIKATKTAIGGHTPDDQEFTNHQIELEKGDTIYMSTDGFADQFNPSDKKLLVKKFKEILFSIHEKPMAEQKIFLHEFIEKWKNDMEQTDDILVIGVRV